MTVYGYQCVLAALTCGKRREFRKLYLRNLSFAKNPSAPNILAHKQRQDTILKQIKQMKINLPITYMNRNELSHLVGDTENEGIALDCSDRLCDDTITSTWVERAPKGIYVFPMAMRDPFNLGAMAKSCAVFNSTLILPSSDAVRITPSALKCSDGWLERIPIVSVPYGLSAEDVIQMVRANPSTDNEFYTIAAVSPRQGGTYQQTPIEKTKRVLLVVGNEYEGVPTQLLQYVHERYTIPSPRINENVTSSAEDNDCEQFIESLNVSTATTCAICDITRRMLL
eukprot:PhF_6_TR30850/c0_g1_i1/m.45401/K03218/rlmB; 23S rRNA (guanosine2251-2'-O)-methyltransferase